MTDTARDKAWAEWRQRDLDIPAAMRGTARSGFNAGWDAAGREVADLLAGYVEELAEARAKITELIEREANCSCRPLGTRNGLAEFDATNCSVHFRAAIAQAGTEGES